MKLETWHDASGAFCFRYRRNTALEQFAAMHTDRRKFFAVYSYGRDFPYDGCGTGGMNNWTRTDYF